MIPKYNNRIYAVIPITEVVNFVKQDTSKGRLSLDGKFLIWDAIWDKETLQALTDSNTVFLYTHEQALELMTHENWCIKTKLRTD